MKKIDNIIKKVINQYNKNQTKEEEENKPLKISKFKSSCLEPLQALIINNKKQLI